MGICDSACIQRRAPMTEREARNVAPSEHVIKKGMSKWRYCSCGWGSTKEHSEDSLQSHLREAAAKPPVAPTPERICNGPHGDEESCPIHGEEIRRARGKTVAPTPEPPPFDCEWMSFARGGQGYCLCGKLGSQSSTVPYAAYEAHVVGNPANPLPSPPTER